MATGGPVMQLAQVLQLGDDMELPDNILIAEICLDDDKDIYFVHAYDVIFDKFTFKFVKRKGNEDLSYVTLPTEYVKRIIFLYPRLVNVARQYNNDEIPEEGIIYEVGTETYVTIGQSQAKYGGKQYLDIRKQFPDENKPGKLIPTKAGIRLNLTLLPEIRGALTASIETTSSLCEKSANILRRAKIALVEKEIKTRRQMKRNCHGCFINHPSQKQHMGEGGCLEQIDWNYIVGAEFDAAYKTATTQNKVVVLATKIASKIGDKGLFMENFQDIGPVETKNALQSELEGIKTETIYKKAVEILEEENKKEDRTIEILTDNEEEEGE